MFGVRIGTNSKKSEAEKPFWISYADLMTALMTLFLVVMVASLISVTKRIASVTEEEKNRKKDIDTICSTLKIKAQKLNKNIIVDCQDNRVNFGQPGRFDKDGYKLKPEGVKALTEVVPLMLEVANGQEGKKWFKQVLIEGFTDTDGSYLYNLHLSLMRSEWVMCTLLDHRNNVGLSSSQKSDVNSLFLAGGVSFNNPKDSKDASRRVALKLQFYGLTEKWSKNPEVQPTFNITRPEVCQLI